jgi:hypothetical protein
MTKYDRLSQVGKFVRGTKEKIDSKEIGPNLPTIEKIRDIFDPTIPYEMSFRTQVQESQIFLDMRILPPPVNNTCAGCVCAVCEVFIGVNYFNTLYNYSPGTVTMFLNDRLTTAFTETDPTSGRVDISASVSSGTRISVCYVYVVC